MTDETASNWYFRIGGQIVIAARAVADPTPFHLENALAKTTRGEDLSEAEAEALAAFKANPPPQRPYFNSADARLGLVAITRRDILETLDRFAADLGELLGPLGEISGWELLEDYCGRALGVSQEEAGLGEDLGLARLAQTETPERLAEIQAGWDASKAFAEAWEASPEGQAAAAAIAPDDGPEGWSQVPGREAEAEALERQKTFARRYRAELGLEPLESPAPAEAAVKS